MRYHCLAPGRNLEANREFIGEKAFFADGQERARVLDVYTDAFDSFRERIEQQLKWSRLSSLLADWKVCRTAGNA